MAGGIRYLVPRNGTYFTRMRVPADLQPLIGKAELMRSLGGDRRAALRKHADTVVEFQRQLDEARQLVAAVVETDAIPERPRPVLSRTMEPGAAVYEYAMQVDESARYTADFRESQRLVDWATRTRPAHSHLLNRVVRGLATDAEIGAVVGWAIDDLYGDAIQRGSPEWRIAAMSLAAGTLEANKHSAALDAGGGPPMPIPFVSRSAAPNAPAKHADEFASRILCEESRLTLTELLPLYQTSRNVSAATISSWGAYVRALNEVTGGPIPVYRITPDHMRALRRLLVNSPANATQRFPGLTITQATAANTKRAKPHPIMSAITAGKWLGGVKTVLEWCSRQDIVPDSPGTNVVIEKPKRSSTDRRLNFNGDDLKRIFNLPGFSKRWGEDEWCYTIALYTGMRASEIAQLTLAGIQREQDVLVFNVEGRLKNADSVRKIPVHSDLIKLGLQARIDELRAAGKTHLFPVWYQEGVRSEERAKFRARKTGSPVTLDAHWPKFLPKRFNVTVKKNAGVEGNKVFHSFRHTFKTGLSVCGVPKDMRDLLAGHTDSSAGAAYIHGHSLVAMSEAMEKMRFDGIDIEALAKQAAL